MRKHFNPRSPHGERLKDFLRKKQQGDISIHAPRTGSDCRELRVAPHRRHFNPRSPHGERRNIRQPFLLPFLFQSTLPARGATQGAVQKEPRTDFNPRSPHGERRLQCGAFSTTENFNPRSPHGERPILFCCPRPGGYFNPRSPHGERLENDSGALGVADFNPRSPHGERRAFRPAWQPRARFQSTLPARGATVPVCNAQPPLTDFNPRSPHGERQRKVTILSIRIIGFAQKVYHKTVLLRISLAENAVILPKRPRNPVRTSLQKAGGLRFARAIRAARPYSISSPSGA